ncbi:hypothetical protein [Cellvibrio zantedeschiae]|nr:hypothetical protein [Cellvibrio zantedeschiae]
MAFIIPVAEKYYRFNGAMFIDKFKINLRTMFTKNKGSIAPFLLLPDG